MKRWLALVLKALGLPTLVFVVAVALVPGRTE